MPTSSGGSVGVEPGAELNRRRQPFHFNQQLYSSRWPLCCDHFVTSAGVRLSSAKDMKRINTMRVGWFWSAQSFNLEESVCVNLKHAIVSAQNYPAKAIL